MKLTEVLDELEIKYCLPGQHHHVRDGWVGLTCPYCPPPSFGKGQWRLGIETNTGRVNCWVCGRHSLLDTLSQSCKKQFGAVKSLLQNVRLVKLQAPQTVSGKLTLPSGIGPLQDVHKSYLTNRGLCPEAVRKLWNVQGTDMRSSLRWRLFVPIMLNGQMISWTSRSISKRSSSKWITAKPDQEALHYKNSLYGIDLIRTTIIVVEGPSDVWNVGPGSGGLFNTMASPSQVSMMSHFPERVVCFDNEPAAQRRARQLCETLSLFPGRTLNICLDAADPGSASRKEISKLRSSFLGA